MAKKSRRVKKRGRQVRLSPAQLVQPGVAREIEASPGAALAYLAPEPPDLREEYGYVFDDLKRIGIIAAAALVVVVVLALVLT